MANNKFLLVIPIILIVSLIGIAFSSSSSSSNPSGTIISNNCPNSPQQYGIGINGSGILSCTTVQTQTSAFFSYGSCGFAGGAVTAITTTTLNCETALTTQTSQVPNSTFWFVNSGNLVVKNDYYGLSGAISASEIPVSVFCPYAGYFKNLAFQLTASSGTGSSIIVTLDKNTVATSLVATCANPATTCVDNTHSVFCLGGANNYMDFQLTETGVPSAGLSIGISVNFVANGV